jgi:hypothetical protein
MFTKLLPSTFEIRVLLGGERDYPEDRIAPGAATAPRVVW